MLAGHVRVVARTVLEFGQTLLDRLLGAAREISQRLFGLGGDVGGDFGRNVSGGVGGHVQLPRALSSSNAGPFLSFRA